jgi:hypothetical protein
MLDQCAQLVGHFSVQCHPTEARDRSQGQKAGRKGGLSSERKLHGQRVPDEVGAHHGEECLQSLEKKEEWENPKKRLKQWKIWSKGFRRTPFLISYLYFIRQCKCLNILS